MIRSQKLVDIKIAPFASALIVESLGEAEPELLSAVTEHVLAHKAPAELADELEPVSGLIGKATSALHADACYALQVLDDEAVVFVTKIWRVLAHETEVAAAGLA